MVSRAYGDAGIRCTDRTARRRHARAGIDVDRLVGGGQVLVQRRVLAELHGERAQVDRLVHRPLRGGRARPGGRATAVILQQNAATQQPARNLPLGSRHVSSLRVARLQQHSNPQGTYHLFTSCKFLAGCWVAAFCCRITIALPQLRHVLALLLLPSRLLRFLLSAAPCTGRMLRPCQTSRTPRGSICPSAESPRPLE